MEGREVSERELVAFAFQEGGGAHRIKEVLVPGAGSGHFPLTSPPRWEILPHLTNLLKVQIFYFTLPLKRKYDNRRERKCKKNKVSIMLLQNATFTYKTSHPSRCLHCCNYTFSILCYSQRFSSDSFLKCAGLLVHSVSLLIRYIWVLYH